jgi:hypothetical protein
MEQAAWMVEVLSEQLDAYPFAVIQHLVNTMGGHVLPAVPAVGFVTVTPATSGVLESPPDQPAPWRFLTGQTEQLDSVEFVPVEARVDVHPAVVASAHLLTRGELHDIATIDQDGKRTVWSREATPSPLFRGERARWVIIATDADAVAEALRGAVARLAERGVGWLVLSVETVGQRVTLEAAIDPLAAFASMAPEGLLPEGDLTAPWGALDDCAWTPTLRVSNHPALPPRLRGSRPLPAGDGHIVLPGVPAHFPLAQLFSSPPAPLPSNVVTAIWDTLVHLDLRLQPLRPLLRRALEDDGRSWVSAALDANLWSGLVARGTSSIYHVRGLPGTRTSLRVVLAVEAEDGEHTPTVQAWPEGEDRALGTSPVAAIRRWGLPLPNPDVGRAMLLVVAYDIPVPPLARAMVVVVGGPAPVFFALDGLLVINAPAVRDGREVEVERSIPEVIDLLHGDLVTAPVMQTLLGGPLPSDTSALLAALPLGHVTASDGLPIRDWKGILVDPSDGTATINTLDAEGRARTFRSGSRLMMEWYRRTDGASGNVPAGAVELVEAEAGARTALIAAENPLATYHGAARESERAALDRLFGPRGENPVLASDYERLVRGALGSRADGWNVRVWGYAERTLVTTMLWPVPQLGDAEDPGTARLAQELRSAGPETLLVALGPQTGPMSEADLDWARRVVRRAVSAGGRRLPGLHDAIVTRCWPLSLTPRGTARGPLPSFSTLPGQLRDASGRSADAPRDVLLLNAAIVRFEAVG